jgi:hypothetical protein
MGESVFSGVKMPSSLRGKRQERALNKPLDFAKAWCRELAKAVKERMGRTGETYAEAKHAIVLEEPEPPPRCLCKKLTKRRCPLHPDKGLGR